MLLLLLVSALLDFFVPTGALAVPFHSVLGAVFLLVGLGFAAAGFYTFKNSGTPVRPGADPTLLVLKGPYRITRNPMYLGLLLFSIGCLLSAKSLWFILPPIFFFLVINFRLIPFEEDLLRKRFGSAYDNYRRRVRRWL